MLRIRVQQNSETVTIELDGSLVGPSVVKLNRVWIEFARLLDPTELFIDLRKVVQADAWGVKALRDIQSLTGAKLVTNSPLSRYIAEDIARHTGMHAAMI